MKTNNESCRRHDHSEHKHNGIELYKHEGALVCSGARDVVGELEAIKWKITNELRILAEWVEEQGGISGHIKAFIEDSTHGYMLSTTGGKVEIKETYRSNIHVSIVAIVFNVDEKILECRIASLISAI